MRTTPSLLWTGALGLWLALMGAQPVAWAGGKDKPAADAPATDGFLMNDVGATVFLPKGWKQTAWADWELKAEAEDKSGFFKLWISPFQMPMTVETATAWTADYITRLQGEQGQDIVVKSTEIKEIGGHKHSWVVLDFNFEIDKHKVPARAVVTAYESEGQVVHMWTIATQANAPKTQKALDEILERMTVTKKTPVLPGRTVLSQAGFTTTLPEGWRGPLDVEMSKVLEKTVTVGKDALPPEKCWTGVKPTFAGDVDIMFACKYGFYPGPVDELSFADVEQELRPKFFGDKASSIPAAAPQKLKDRTGFLWAPPNGTFRLAAVPYDGGLMLVYGLAGKGASNLDAALAEALTATEFTSPGGGQPIIGPDAWVSYYVTYKKTSPIVWGPLLGFLAVASFMVFAFTRKSPAERQGNDSPY